MSAHLRPIFFLTQNPIEFSYTDARAVSPEGISTQPPVPTLDVNQGDDPPFGGSGARRPFLQTLYGHTLEEQSESPMSVQRKETIQFRVAQIVTLLGKGGTYALPEDEFAHDFDASVEIEALHRIVDAQWGNEDIVQAIGGHGWIIRLASLKAYVALHMNLIGINLDDQRSALGSLRSWFYLEERSLANAAVKTYETLLSHILEYNKADQQLTHDLLEKERKALQASLIEHTEPSEGKERDQSALTFVRDLTKAD